MLMASHTLPLPTKSIVKRLIRNESSLDTYHETDWQREFTAPKMKIGLEMSTQTESNTWNAKFYTWEQYMIITTLVGTNGDVIRK